LSASAAPPSWYLVRTKLASESLAASHLARQGFQVYFPRLVTRVRRSGRLISAIRPLFARYLFVGLEAGKSLGSVRFTRGVSEIVRFGAELAAVPGTLIEQLRRRADPVSGLHHVESSRLAPGASVQIISGAFGGLEGIFECECGDQRVVVLLDILGQNVRVFLGAADIAPGVASRAC
jgi:transcriptional antiterminator RfaH